MVFLPPGTVQEIHVIGKGQTSLVLQAIHHQMGYHPYNRRVSMWRPELEYRASVHSSETYFLSARTIAAILALVQFLINAPSSHSLIPCWSVLVVPQREQVVVLARLIAANRSSVGKMSCMVAYHVDFIVSGSPAACGLAQTRYHGSAGYLWTICISLRSLLIFNIISSTP
jgi:hypothetical protein